MKINNITLIFIASCAIGSLHADIERIIIENQYAQKAVIVNIDGKDIMELQPKQSEYINGWPKQIKIRAKGSPFSHSGIQEELLYIQNINRYGKSEGNNTAIITILPTTNVLHFNYKTDLKYIPKGPAPTRPLPQIPNKSLQKSIFVRNDTNNTITLRITTEDDGQLAPKQIGSHNFIPLELYDGIVFKTAMVELGSKTINMLPNIRNCLQNLTTFSSGNHIRIIHINQNGSIQVESQDK